MKGASPILLWAVVVKSKRTEWIHWMTISRTKKESWKLYCDQWIDRKYPEEELEAKRVRLSTVVVGIFHDGK